MVKMLKGLYLRVAANGFYKLYLLFALVILWQWNTPLNEIWYEETLAITRLTLLTIWLVHTILPFRIGYRCLAISVILLLVQYYVLTDYHVFDPASAKFFMRCVEFILALHPYIWFSVIVWVAYEAILLIVRRKSAIIAFITLNIIGLAILDSFTTMLLWSQVAWIVLAGLSWIIADHFCRLKNKYPDGWRHLSNYPVHLASTVAVLLAAIMIAGISMPNAAPVLMDPYSAWKTWKGEEVPTFYNGKGEVFTLSINTTSGYSREDSSLGGSFEFDYGPIMKVKTTHRSYWRGETKSLYTGTGWEDSVEEKNEKKQPLAVKQRLPTIGLEPGKHLTREVTASVTMVGDTPYPVLFGAYSIEKVVDVDGKPISAPLQWDAMSSELLWNNETSEAYPKTYTIVSQVPVPNEKLLRQSSAQRKTDSAINKQTYLQLPPNFSAKVKDLAAAVTEGKTNDYDKVRALEQYLSRKYQYTNTPDLTLKKSKDFVESFLFEIKEGYCDYFSTSLVTMSRSLGIPARWVKGYTPGSKEGFRPDSIGGMPSQMREWAEEEEGTYLVSNSDAHSWAEVYFEGAGWIPFEATPGFSLPRLQDETPGDVNVNIPLNEPDNEAETSEEEVSTNWTPGFKAIVLAVSLTAAALLIWVFGVQLADIWHRVVFGRKLSPNQKLIIMTERWIRLCQRKGFYRKEYETLRESVKRWESEDYTLNGAWSVLLLLFEKAKYSGVPVTEQECLDARVEMKRLEQRL